MSVVNSMIKKFNSLIDIDDYDSVVKEELGISIEDLIDKKVYVSERIVQLDLDKLLLVLKQRGYNEEEDLLAFIEKRFSEKFYSSIKNLL